MNSKTEGDTLLAHLAWKLAKSHEDIAVEALGYILRSDPLLRAMEAILREGGAGVGTIAKVRPQVHGEGDTRLDLVALDVQGEECVLIEAKFWAGLTGNQPNVYLKRLPPGKALLFVAPELRIVTLWSKLRCLAGVGHLPSDPDKADFKSVATDAGKRLMLISWRHLLNRLEAAGDSQLRSEIQQLRGLASRHDSDAFLPLRPEEFAPEFPRRLVSLGHLVDDAVKKARDLDPTRVTPQAWGYGYPLYYSGGGAWFAWFGIASDLWARGSYPDTPLWLRFWKGGGEKNVAQWPRTLTALGHLMRKNPPSAFEHDGGIIVPIDLPTGVEYDEVLKAVVNRLHEVADLIEQHRP